MLQGSQVFRTASQHTAPGESGGARDANAAWRSALLAAAAGTVAMLAARRIFGILTPAELFGDRLTAEIPLPLFERLLGFFGPNAKHWFFAGLVLGETLLTALAGVVYWRLRTPAWRASRRLRRVLEEERPAPTYAYREIPAVGVWVWVLSAGVLAPAIGGGFFGAGLPGGASAVAGAELAPDAVFAVVFIALMRAAGARARTRAHQVARAPTGVQVSRRRLIQLGAGAVVVVAGGGAAVWAVVSRFVGATRPNLALGGTPDRIVPAPVPEYVSWTPVAGQTAEVTPVAAFYYVSKNLLSDPAIDAATWRLTVGGLVEKPYTLSYDELRSLPAVERYQTLECISNVVGGNLMSTGLFRGTRLADVVQRAGAQPGANELIFQAADGYSDRLHLSQALDLRSLIVYALDGEPLAQAHGFPARLLIPGLYGMKNGKWLTELTLSAGNYMGYWELRGWTAEARVKLTARIDVPADGAALAARPVEIAGVAYAGAAGIGRVEVSTDAGTTWKAAELEQPLDDLTWVLWRMRWTPRAGSYVIAARAIDRAGNVQTPVMADPLPDGASGYQAIHVTVG